MNEIKETKKIIDQGSSNGLGGASNPKEQIQKLSKRLSNSEITSQQPLEPIAQSPTGEKKPLEWVDQSIQTVKVADVPDPDLTGAQDFQKVPIGEMQTGLQRLQEMKPAIDQGIGNSRDYWAEVDKRFGKSYPDGYQKIYEAFYGLDSIRVTKDGDQYDITNGRHRIWLAKRMGIETLPMRVIEKDH